MKSLTLEEQIYFCKYHDVDTSLHTTIGIKEEEIKPTIAEDNESKAVEEKVKNK